MFGLIINMFTGCQEKEEGPLVISAPYLIDYSDSIFDLNCNSEYELVDKDSTFHPRKNVKISFNGEEYSGTYIRNVTAGRGMSSVAYEYSVQKDGKVYYFEINEKGKLTEFRCSSQYVYESSEIISCEDALLIAEDFLKEHIAFSSFTPDDMSGSVLNNGYKFQYIRYIGGVQTVEFVSVCVALDGKITNYYARVVEELNDCPDLSQIDFDAATQALYQKIDTLTNGVKTRYDTIEYQKPEYELTVLKDGSFGLYCTVEVIGKKYLTDTIYENGGEKFTFIIPLVRETKS